MTSNHAAPPPSWDLVVRAQAGCQEAFTAIWLIEEPKIWSYILRRVGGNRAVADDLTQDVALRAVNRIHSVTWQNREIGAWLMRIATNIVVDYHRSAPVRRSSTFEPGDPVFDEADTGPGACEVVADAILHRQLREKVSQLPALQRQCVELRFYRELSVSETATAMQSTQGAVKALLCRAMKTLRKAVPAEQFGAAA